MRFWIGVALCGLVMGWGTAHAAHAAPARETVSLNGPWRMAVSRGLVVPGDKDAWKPVEVPTLRDGKALGGSDYAFFRRDIDVPARWRNRRVFLRLAGARYHPRVYVDDKLVGVGQGGGRIDQAEVPVGQGKRAP